mgnify:FL=1
MHRPHAGRRLLTAVTETPPQAQVDQYASGSGTWTKPSWARTVRVYMVAAGRGGGGAARRASGTASMGGGGGSAGTRVELIFDAAALPSTVSYSVGTGGTGGAGATADNTHGSGGGS